MDYQKIYNQIIKRAKNRELNGYTEKHHIVPKCLGGNYDKENLVRLTAREHFLCHKILCKIHPNNNKLWYALWLMAIGKKKKYINQYNISSKEYEYLRINFINNITGRKKPQGFGKGKKITWGNKISESLKGKPKPEGFNKNNSKLKGRLINNKPILQFNKNGDFMQEWNSAKEAERHYNMSNNCINSCLKEKTKTSGGYIWKYKK